MPPHGGARSQGRVSTGAPKLPPLPGERGASHSRVGQEGGLCLHHCLLPRGLGETPHTHTLTLTEITDTHMEITHTYGNHAATYTHTPAYTGLEVAEEPKAHLLRPTPHTPAPGQALASAPSLLPQPGWSPRRLPPAVPTAPSAHMRVVDLPRLAPNYP